MFLYFVRLHTSVQCWKMDGKDIADTSKLVKGLYVVFLYRIAQTAMLDKIIYG